MELPEAEKKKREQIARDLEEVFIILFLVIAADYELDRLEEKEYYIDFLGRYYEETARKYLEEKEVLFIVLVAALLEDIVETTLEHIQEGDTQDLSDNEYFLSDDRALDLAENGANIIADYGDYENAVENGYSKKQWLTMRDSKVRDTHVSMEGKTIPINDYFDVNGSKMRYPHDLSMNPDIAEVSNCRCVCHYIK